MKREPERFANEQFDLLVVGAGIYGSTIAAVAAEQGLTVALIDKQDFGHATSANSQKIIHGGLRYLQHLDVKRMRESVAARRQFMTFAPHLVRPLQCIVPTRGHGLRSKAVLAVAMALNDLVSWDRNDGLDAAHRLPRGRIVSATECLRMIPGLKRGDVTGGAAWFDAMALNTERLTLAFVASAAANGACVANYVEAVDYLMTGNRICGVAARDVLGGGAFDIRASLVVNAMGPWSGTLGGPGSNPDTELPRRWCRAMNIVVNRRLFGDYAVGLTAGRYVDRDAVLNKGTRDYFFAPWRESTIIGTFYDRQRNAVAGELVGADDIERLLLEVNSAYPAADLSLPDVGFVHAGLLPEAQTSQDQADVQLLKHAVVTGGGPGPAVPGLLSVVGVKYTTAAQVAQRIVRIIRDRLGRTSGRPGPDSNKRDRCTTADGKMSPESAVAAEIAPAVGERLRERYGSARADVWRFLQTPADREPLCPDPSVLAGELVYAMRTEMAHKLSDIVFRRTGIGADRYPGRATLVRCAEVMAAEQGWTRQRMTQEIVEVEQRYSVLFDAGCVARPESPDGTTAGAMGSQSR